MPSLTDVDSELFSVKRHMYSKRNAELTTFLVKGTKQIT